MTYSIIMMDRPDQIIRQVLAQPVNHLCDLMKCIGYFSKYKFI